MCGIIGIFSLGQFDEPKEGRSLQTETSIILLNELLKQTRSRGEDATGVGALFDDGNYTALKMGLDAAEFVTRFGNTEKHWDGFVKILRETKSPIRGIIGHCRKTSVGNASDNKNNHPVRVDDILGIHNGTLKNQDIIFKKLGCERDGEVDSEAIFRLFSHYTNNGKLPLTSEIMSEVALRLEGGFTTLMLCGNNPFQIGMLRDGRPAEIAYIKPYNLAVVASERKFLQYAFYEFNQIVTLYGLKSQLQRIEKDDVEFKTVGDCKSIIFGLNVDVTNDLKISDFIVEGDIERMPTNKFWTVAKEEAANKKTTKTTTTKTGNVQASTPTKANTATKDTKTTVNKKRPEGMVWNAQLNKYVSTAKEDEHAKLGSVEMDVAIWNGKVTELDKKEEDNKENNKDEEVGIDLSETSEDIVDITKDESESNIKDSSEKGNRSKINQLTTEEEKKEKEEKTAKAVVKEIVMVTKDPKISQLAAEEAKKQPLYETLTDITERLDIMNVSAIGELEPAAFANRISRFAYSDGYHDGYKKAKEELGKSTKEVTICRPLDKRETQNYIRILKLVVRILTKANKYRTPTVDLDAIEKAVDEIKKKDDRMLPSEAELNTVFNKGDYKNPVLLTLKGVIKTACAESNP